MRSNATCWWLPSLAVEIVAIAWGTLALVPAWGASRRYDRLISAVQRRNPAAVRRELDGGADVDGLPDSVKVEATSPLTAAAQDGDTAIARLLLDRGADPNLADGWCYPPLTWAAAGGHARVAELLICRGAHVNDQPDGASISLWRAAVEGERATVALLLAHGAKAGAGEDGEALVDVVREEGHPEIAVLLRDAAVRR